MKIKSTMLLLVAILAVAGLAVVSVGGQQADADVSATQIAGTDLDWSISDNVLTVSYHDYGTGVAAIPDYADASSAPWNTYKASVTSLVIDAKVTVIGDYAFSGFTACISVEFGDDCKKIGVSSFEGAGLTSMNLNKVEELSAYSFKNCTSLKTLRFPVSINVVADYLQPAFSGVTLTEITIDAPTDGMKVFDYNKDAFDDSRIQSSVMYLSKDTLNKVNVGTATQLPNNFLRENAAIITLDLTGIQYIGAVALDQMSELKTLIIPDLVEVTVQSLGKWGNALYLGNSLENITVNEDFVRAGWFVSENRRWSDANSNNYKAPTSLCKITIVASNDSAKHGTDFTNSNYYKQTWFSNSMTVELVDFEKIPSYMFRMAKTGLNIVQYTMEGDEKVLSNTVTQVGTNSFINAVGVTVDLENVRTIGSGAFQDSGITVVDLSSAVTIGSNSFKNVTSLTKLSLGSDIDYPDEFGDLVSVTTLDMPSDLVLSQGVKNIIGNLLILDEILVDGSAPPSSGNVRSSQDAILVGNTIIRFMSSSVTDFVMPDGVTEVIDRAFTSSSSLESIKINKDLETFGSSVCLGSANFTGFVDSDTLNVNGFYVQDHILYKNGVIICVPNNITELTVRSGDTIPAYAYSGSALVSINITGGVVGDYAFKDCQSLTTLSVSGDPDLGIGLFQGCSALTNVSSWEISNVPDYAFSGSGLEDFDFSNVSTIGEYSFEDTSIVELDLKQITTLSEGSFKNCSSITKIEFPVSLDLVVSHSYPAFEGCTNVTEAVLNKCVEGKSIIHYDAGVYPEYNYLPTYLSRYAFTTVTIGDATQIPDCLFRQCNKITYLDLTGVTSIGTRTFDVEGQNKIETVIAPDLVESISYRDRITFGTGVTKLVMNADCKAEYSGHRNKYVPMPNITDLTIVRTGGAPAKTIYDDYTHQPWYSSREKITSLTLIDMDDIPANMFRENPYINPVFKYTDEDGNLQTTDSVRTLGNYAFYGCSSLTTLGEVRSTIGNYSLTGCTSLTMLDLSTVTSIGSNALKDCSGLTSVTIGDPTFVAEGSLAGCTSLAAINPAAGTSSADGNALTVGGLLIKYAPMNEDTEYTIDDSVVRIGNGAFSNATALTVVHIPVLQENGLGTGAFSGCSGMAYYDVEVPESGNYYYESEPITGGSNLGNKGCTVIYYYSCNMSDEDTIVVFETPVTPLISYKTIIIASSDVTIGAGMISGNKLEVLRFTAEGVTLTDGAVQDATSLKEIYLVNGQSMVSDTGGAAFTFPSGGSWALNKVVFVGVDGAHDYASYAEALNTPWSLATNAGRSVTIDITDAADIGAYQFAGCKNLTLDISGISGTIGTNAFQGATFASLTVSVDSAAVFSKGTVGPATYASMMLISETGSPDSFDSVYMNVPWNAATEIDSLTLPSNMVAVSNSMFRGSTAIDEIVLPATVLSIGDQAFRNSSVASVTGTGVASVGVSAFESASSMSVASLPSLVSIGDYSFMNTSSLEKLQAPQLGTLAISAFNGSGIVSADIGSTSVITQTAFINCTNLTTVKSTAKELYLENGAFSNCPSLSTMNAGPIVHIGDDALLGCSSLRSLVLKMDAAEISLQDNTAIRDVDITACDGVIAPYAFSGCTSLQSVTMASGITGIGAYAFYGCSLLPAIQIPATVLAIGASAFEECDALMGIDIPSTVTAVYDRAFYGCDSLDTALIGDVSTLGADLSMSVGSLAFAECPLLTYVLVGPFVSEIAEDAFGDMVFTGPGGEVLAVSATNLAGTTWAMSETGTMISAPAGTGHRLINDEDLFAVLESQRKAQQQQQTTTTTDDEQDDEYVYVAVSAAATAVAAMLLLIIVRRRV